MIISPSDLSGYISSQPEPTGIESAYGDYPPDAIMEEKEESWSTENG